MADTTHANIGPGFPLVATTTHEAPRAGAAREASPRRPTLVIEPKAGWSAIDLRELWLFRDLVYGLAGRDLKLRYKQTVLGVLWVVLQPLFAAGIFSFVFGVVAKMPSDGVPYFVFSYAGLLAWNLFGGALTKTSGCLVGNSQLISKVFFPRMVLPLSTIPGVLVDFAATLVLMFGLMVAFRVPPTRAMLTLPLWIGALLMLSQGLGLVAAALAVSYRDVTHMLPVLTQMLLYVSPVAYPIRSVPAAYRNWFYINPLAALIDGARWATLGAGAPNWGWSAYAVAVSAAAWVAGSYAFKRMERQFADVI